MSAGKRERARLRLWYIHEVYAGARTEYPRRATFRKRLRFVAAGFRYEKHARETLERRAHVRSRPRPSLVSRAVSANGVEAEASPASASGAS